MEGRHTYPQGTNLVASSINREPEVVAAATSSTSAFSSPEASSTGAREHSVSDNNARTLKNNERHPYDDNSFSSSQINSDVHSEESSSNLGLHETSVSASAASGHYEETTNVEDSYLDGDQGSRYGNDLQVDEETRRRLEIARVEEIKRQNKIKQQEKIRRQEEEKRLRMRERQDELRRQQEENMKLEEENRLRELESRRQEELRTRKEEEARIERENRARLESTAIRGGRINAINSYSVHEPGLLTRSNDNVRNTNVARNNSSISSSTITRTVTRNTIGPISPNGTRYSYVGRSYGNDIVGHEPLQNIPYVSGRNASLLLRNSNDGSGTLISNGRTTTTRRVNVTRTVYSFPDPSGGNRAISSNFPPPYYSKLPFSQPRKNSHHVKSFSRETKHHRQIPSPSRMSSTKAKSDFVSAYAFTGGETEYADGQEFAESESPVIATITVDQARELRRKWRRKRHHMLRNLDHGKGKKKMRKGRSKKMRKGLKNRQAWRKYRKMMKKE